MSFQSERQRVVDATGPGALAGVNTATIGTDRVYRDARETEAEFVRRVYRLSRRAGVRVASVEGLLVITGGKQDAPTSKEN